MLIEREIISGQILTLLESKGNAALTFHEITNTMRHESEILISRSLLWLVQEGLITESSRKEFKIKKDELITEGMLNI